MKYLLFIFLMGCTASAQNQSEETKEDIEFQKLMNKVTQTNDLSVQVQAKASEVTILKTELSEVKATLDSVSNDTGVSFRIYAIPNNKEN
jgi:hypothetical protein